MPDVHNTPEEQQLGHLSGLRDLVESYGFDCETLRFENGHPSLHVANPEVPLMEDRVIVAPVGSRLWFWWVWGRRIAPADDVRLAAREVIRVLAAG